MPLPPKGPTRTMTEPLPEPSTPPLIDLGTHDGDLISISEERHVRVVLDRSRSVPRKGFGGDLYVALALVTWTRHTPDVEWTRRQVYLSGTYWNVEGFALHALRPGIWAPGEKTYFSTKSLPGWLDEIVTATRPAH